MTNRPEIILSRNARALGTSRSLERAIRAGVAVRVGVGAFVRSEAWHEAQPDDRYRLVVRAAAAISPPDSTFSHESAAAMWRLPMIGKWPTVAHQVVGPSGGGSSRVGIRRHAIGLDPDALVIDHVRVTSLERTIIDVASTSNFVTAVGMADRALAGTRVDEDSPARATTKPRLLNTLDARQSLRGFTRARRVIDFASTQAQSPLESLARVQFALLGYPPPLEQVAFADEKGHIGTTDFFWPEHSLVVEADGLKKYGDERLFQRDLPDVEVFLAEKRREDRIRRQVRSFARIDWALASDSAALAEHLAPYGLRRRSRGEIRQLS